MSVASFSMDTHPLLILKVYPHHFAAIASRLGTVTSSISSVGAMTLYQYQGVTVESFPEVSHHCLLSAACSWRCTPKGISAGMSQISPALVQV